MKFDNAVRCAIVDDNHSASYLRRLKSHTTPG
jgi:hypothetical protein